MSRAAAEVEVMAKSVMKTGATTSMEPDPTGPPVCLIPPPMRRSLREFARRSTWRILRVCIVRQVAATLLVPALRLRPVRRLRPGGRSMLAVRLVPPTRLAPVARLAPVVRLMRTVLLVPMARPVLMARWVPIEPAARMFARRPPIPRAPLHRRKYRRKSLAAPAPPGRRRPRLPDSDLRDFPSTSVHKKIAKE